MEFKGTSRMLCVYKHRDNSPEMMSADAHSMMIRVFLWRMILGVPLTFGLRYKVA